jgi:hypothetical protein
MGIHTLKTQLHSHLGDAVGDWQGDTLVIEAVNITTDSWLSKPNLLHTNKRQITERLRRMEKSTKYNVTIDDRVVLE